MKKAGKSGGGKAAAGVKVLVERVEEGAKWISSRRESVTFAPGMRDQVARWESEIKVEETPLGKWLSIQRKAREKRRKLVEKVCSLRNLHARCNMLNSTIYLQAKAGEGELLDN